eukprot:11880365-Prorocentrum_lima.AAC.1
MQVEILPEADTQFNSSTIPKLDNAEYEWEWRGRWLIGHHRKPRRKTFRPHLNSSELSALELEDFNAMICHEHPGDGKKGE